MTKTRAIVVVDGGKVAAVCDAEIPKIRDEWVIVEVKAVALNPTDWKMINWGAADAGSRVGCDYAGIVAEVGSKVAKSQKGDRIAGFVHWGQPDHETGAFGEYIIAKAALQFHIPDNLNNEEAATLGVSVATVGQGLYKCLGLPFPNAPAKEPIFLLICAASTATGIYGIQYAKASGLTVIATASLHNFDLVKSLGADAVFDYHSPTCASDIKTYTGNKLKYAWDCMGTGVETCAAAISDVEPDAVYGTIVPGPADEKILKQTNSNVDGPRFTLGYDVFGEKYIWMVQEVPQKPDEMEFATAFFEMSQGLFEKGIIKPIRPTVNSTELGWRVRSKAWMN